MFFGPFEWAKHKYYARILMQWAFLFQMSPKYVQESFPWKKENFSTLLGVQRRMNLSWIILLYLQKADLSPALLRNLIGYIPVLQIHSKHILPVSSLMQVVIYILLLVWFNLYYLFLYCLLEGSSCLDPDLCPGCWSFIISFVTTFVVYCHRRLDLWRRILLFLHNFKHNRLWRLCHW